MGIKSLLTAFKVSAGARLTMVFLLSFLLPACTVKLVQPYDEKLFNDTEAFYKKAAEMIEQGKLVSPVTDEQRAEIAKPAEHPGHITAFEPKYLALFLDSDALILRAMANSQAVDSMGSNIQNSLNDVIDKSIPSSCPELVQELGKVSLTAMNFVDLKCTVLKWRDQHRDDSFTQGKRILKKSNWEGRKIAIFDTILAIQKAEGFKKNK